MSPTSSGLGWVRDLVLGLLALALLSGGLVVAYLSYNRVLIPHRDITLQTDVVGNALQVGSDVKLNGVPVGSVTDISATDEGADLRLALDPQTLDDVPDNVVARLLPKTMFGERYVALVVPSRPSSTTLRAGDVIHQDASAEAAELQQVFDELLPVLRAIQPQKLSAMLHEFSDMLEGQGRDLGDAMVEWSHYVEKLTPHVPQMSEDLDRLARVADQWNVAAPDLVDALSTMTTSAQTLVDEKARLSDVYATVISSADTTRGWLSDNDQTIEVLAKESKAALRATEPYASQFPCLFRAVANFKPRMDQALGAGTDEPGMHGVLTVMPARSKYLVGTDDLQYTEGTPPPRCPYVTGEVGTEAARRSADTSAEQMASWPRVPAATDGDDEPAQIGPPPGDGEQSYLRALAGLGDANSPGENELIAELVAPTQGMAPSDYPRWNSLLLGPTLRNTKVVLK
jgi:phospholipid/cholesterol/gamma-HCH transport system substrate-binding protein